MKRPTDEQLVLHYYGESPDAAELDRMIDESSEVSTRFDEIRQLLDSVEAAELPSRDESYGRETWLALEPRLEKKRRWRNVFELPTVRKWSLAGAAAALLVVAFFAGRLSTPEGGEQTMTLVEFESSRDRALYMTVAGHLERSEMLLLELSNVDSGNEIDLQQERLRAADLKSQSRLYRQAAIEAGQFDVADLLESVEIVLVELANGADDLGPGDLVLLQERLKEGDLLFRVRIVGSRLREDAYKTKRVSGKDDTIVDV